MTTWVYVDETKRAGYVIAAVTVSDPEAVRKVIRGLILPGQRRLHMKHEQPRRRRAIVSALTAVQVEVAIYDAARHYRTDLDARAACLTALVDNLSDSRGNTRLVIEQDDSLVRSDQAVLYRAVRQAGRARTTHYDHQPPAAELLLALPDVAAWCWVRSGEWRRRIDPILTNIYRV